MNVLVTDFIFENTHKDMNSNFIRAISKFADCDVVSVNGYYDDVEQQFAELGVRIINRSISKQMGMIGYRKYSYRLQKMSSNLVFQKQYDAVIVLCFDTVSTSLLPHVFFKIPTFLFYHRNIDELNNRIKRMAFSKYKGKLYHVVFEDFFRERLVKEIGLSSNRVYVVPHPAKPIKNVPTKKEYDCIGLCNSNDEVLIQKAVERESVFLHNKLHVLLRSKSIEKKNSAVEVIKGFMDKDVYDELMAAGKTVFVPLPETYVYRLSGSIYDALSRGKIAFTTSKYYAKEYERRYPGICKYVGSVEQLIENLLDNNKNGAAESFQKFLAEHSIETVSNVIECMVKTVLSEIRTKY